MIGLIIIIVFPFMFFYTQMNNLNRKTSAIKKAIDKEKETYIDPIDMCERWTATGEKVYRGKWVYKTIKTEDAIEGDDVLFGLNTYKIYRNYSKEKYIADIQWQIDHGRCWCWERHAFNNKNKKDYHLHYHMKGKYFYRLNWDDKTHNYYIEYYNNGKKEIINYEKYRELGGFDWEDRKKRYKL